MPPHLRDEWNKLRNPPQATAGFEKTRRPAGFPSVCRESWYIAENTAHEAPEQMSQTLDTGGPPPPYFNISPDEALAELDPPVGTADFGRIAALCAQGRADLVGRGHETSGARRLRLFSTWEITKYLIPVATPHFRRVLRANPALPQGRTETQGGARWFTLDEVLRLRAHFAAEGSRAKEYRPYRPAGLPAKVCAVANFKGGVGKTSMAAHLAMSAALDGYRVLVVDLDSQGSMTSIFGGRVASEWDTVFPLIARDYALGLQAENRRRAERGDAPLPLEDTLAEALKRTGADIIQRTHWPNIDLIGAQLNLYWAEFQIPVWRMSLRGWKLWEALANGLQQRRHLRRLRHRAARYPAGARVPHDQRPDRRRHPAGADGRLVPGIRLHRTVLRHAAFHLRLDRGRRERRRPRARARRDPLRVGRGARHRHPLRRRPAGRARRADAGLSRAHPLALAAGLHRAGRPGRRAGERHLRGRLPRLQPRHLRPRPPDLRPDLCRLQAAAARVLAPRRAGRRSPPWRPPDGPPPPRPRRAPPRSGCSACGTSGRSRRISPPLQRPDRPGRRRGVEHGRARRACRHPAPRPRRGPHGARAAARGDRPRPPDARPAAGRGRGEPGLARVRSAPMASAPRSRSPRSTAPCPTA